MRYFKQFIIFMGLFFIFIVGCSNGIEIKGNEIYVQKRLGEENTYEDFRKVTDDEVVQKVKDILATVDWENVVVDMVHPPNYKFYFQNSSEQPEKLDFHLWISPNKDQIELVIEGESKYAQLDKSKSAELFEAIIGTKLSEED